MSVNAGENVVGVYVGSELISGGKNSSVKFYTDINGSVNEKTKDSAIFSLDNITQFTIETAVVSNYSNYSVIAGNGEDLSDGTEIASGTFGENGKKNIIQCAGYTRFKIRVSPGSAQYASYARYWIETGIYE